MKNTQMETLSSAIFFQGKMIIEDDQQFNPSIWTVVPHSSTTVISYSPRDKVSLPLENRVAR